VSRTFSLPHDVSSATLARRHVEEFAADQMLDDKTKALAIIATELVTNAVRHGAQPVELRLRCERDAVTVEVTDGDRRVDRVRIPAAHERTAGGQGLFLVASLADRWGARLAQTGKTVWATINTAHA
jgi:anti-sigma regulatory factor (Ser/Thr protein kinase)